VTYTVNPDGSAKVKFDVVTVKPFSPYGLPVMGGKKEEDKDIDDLVRDALRPFLESPGISAWKDVSAEYVPSGKLKLSGTAYVRKLQDFKPQGPPLLSSNFQVERGADGSFKLVASKDTEPSPTNQRKRKTAEEIKKMTDAELDKYILLERIDLQAARPLVVSVVSGAKLKSTYVLPGDLTAVTGFERNGRTVSKTLEGDKVIGLVDKLLAQDNAAWRKFYREATDPNPITQLNLDGLGAPNGSVTVAKPAAIFDFDKEVKEARDAYPTLRKKFGFGDDLRLPTTDNPPKFPPPPKE